MKFRTLPLAALILAMALSAPARAEKVLCDGNPLCIVTLVPLVAVGVAVNALKPNPPEKNARQAIDAGNSSQLQFVLQTHPDLLKDPEKSHGLLLAAASAGNLDATKLLLDAGVPANTGKSRALWYATTVAEIELLLSRGASASEMDLGSMSYRFGSPNVTDLVTTLLNQRGPLDPNDAGALSLLSSAVNRKQLDVVRLLLQRGVNPNGTPARPTLVTLAYACSENDTACEATMQTLARELIDKGADASFMATMYCKTPLQAATQRHNQALITLLESAGARAESEAQAQCHERKASPACSGADP